MSELMKRIEEIEESHRKVMAEYQRRSGGRNPPDQMIRLIAVIKKLIEQRDQMIAVHFSVYMSGEVKARKNQELQEILGESK